MVSRSALKSVQISCDSSSMISSTSAVAWILLVTVCRFLKKASRPPISARPPDSLLAATAFISTSFLLCRTGKRTQTAFQHGNLETALREQEGGRGAAPAGLTINNIFPGLVQQGHGGAQLVERHIERPRQAVVLILGRKAHIQPGRAAPDAL